MTLPKEEVPSCFAKEWDARSPECAGGPDIGYVNPKTGQHVREQCSFFSACGARMQAARQAANAQPFIRPPIAPPPPPRPPQPQAPPPQSWQDNIRAQQAAYIDAQRQSAMSAPRPPIPAQPQAPHPYYAAQHPQAQPQYPATNYQLNYQMPGYLSVPEERQPGEGIMPVLGREVFRSMFKAVGHSVSHFFDVRPMRDK